MNRVLYMIQRKGREVKEREMGYIGEVSAFEEGYRGEVRLSEECSE